MAGRWSYPAASSEAATTSIALPRNASIASLPSDATATLNDETPGPPRSWSGKSWDEVHARPATLTRNDLLVAMIETLAVSDPARALGLAQAEPNRLLRDRLMQSVLRGWGRSSPTHAGQWALALVDPAAREAALKSVFAGAVAGGPDAAIDVGKILMAQNVGEPLAYGGHLLDALCDAGYFEAAAQFAATGDANQRTFWLQQAYSKWASFQPERAAEAAATIEDPGVRALALHGVIGGWADANPAGAVQFATQLPNDGEKSALISQSLLRWTKTDLKAASDWINNHELGTAMDQGISSVANEDYIKPDVALSWAESVVNPKLRSETLASVLRRWATTDLAAAKQYAETTKNLLPDDQQEISGLIATLSGQKP